MPKRNKNGLPRDVDRQKVYRAEHRFQQTQGAGGEWRLLTDIQEARNIRNALLPAYYDPDRIRIKYGRSDMRRLGWASTSDRGKTWKITLHRNANAFVVLHELAHCITPWEHLDHGQRFRNEHIALTSAHFTPKAADQLEFAYRLQGLSV